MNRLHFLLPDYTLDNLCSLFGKTRQAYYQHVKYNYRENAAECIILELVKEFRKSDKKLGGRKLQKMVNLRLPENMQIGRDTLFNLLDKEHLKIKRKVRRTKTTFSNHWMNKYPNLIREIVPTAANQIWVSDITYIDTKVEGFVYLHLITDAYSRKIVGWFISNTMHADYTANALKMALQSMPYKINGLIHHSDRGCQYCSDRYVKLLQAYGIMISMTENGDPLENAIAERVNGILKMEWIREYQIADLKEAKAIVSNAINVYNNVRPHLSLDYHTPNEAYEMTGEIKRCWKNYYSSKKVVDENGLNISVSDKKNHQQPINS